MRDWSLEEWLYIVAALWAVLVVKSIVVLVAQRVG